ncbi:hypothetical protein [Micromonospora yangpuensis]|uniref:Uncharacterized protein n=1 Tax=Micromonospora yangpuensis TaxID=683228 RepID=A0A1C6UAM9_9ACTN|nr:hypothetical protein [Micromonospora yangpuensis]GGL87284.1 hypothetical protein GCM10012279_01210 [Micromonospora yangpuensis]SCL51145.1 hypothetical protein GA0070617_1694 [Micromonospora yangpuensis]
MRAARPARRALLGAAVVVSDRATVVVCAECDGSAVRVDPCRCTRYGDRFLAADEPPRAADDPPRAADEPPRNTDEPSRAADEPARASAQAAYRDCVVCRRIGQVAGACQHCRRTGRRRAELVLTVANLDTGAVASHRLRPGGLAPRPDRAAGWVVDLPARVRELAATVGVAVTGDGPAPVVLPQQWRPDLPAEQRYVLEAQALVARDRVPWWVLTGRSDAPPPVDPAARLAELCAVANLLLLDLVIEVRRQAGWSTWDIRYEVPGSPVGTGLTGRSADGLPDALARTDVRRALDGLAARGRTAPAYLLRPELPAQRGPLRPVPVDLDELERRLRNPALGGSAAGGSALGGSAIGGSAVGGELPGAQAIWRDHRWWHTSLCPDAPVEELTEDPTGQVIRRVRVPLRRDTPPPPPAWQGEPVPWRPCPDCVPGTRLCACLCTLGGRPAAPDCAACSGAGRAPSVLSCHTCGGTHRLYRTLTVTLTDLRHRVIHLAWHAGTPEPAPLVATQPGGRPVVQLPERYRLAAWASILGVRPDDLTEADGGFELTQDLRDGYVTLPSSVADPVTEHLDAAGPGLPAGRLIVAAVHPTVPPVAELIRHAVGLDLACVIQVWDLRANAGDPLRIRGRRWSVELLPTPVRPTVDDVPYHPSVEAAVAYCLEYLDTAYDRAVPVDPEQPLPAPASAARPLPADPVPALERLAAGHPGQVLTVAFTRAGCVVHHHDDDQVRPLAHAPDLPTLLTTLRLP